MQGGEFTAAGGKPALFIAEAVGIADLLDSDGDGIPDEWETTTA